MFEKVNPSHPDKVADRIAGAMVDLAYQNADNPRVAVEVLIGHHECHIIAETSYSYTREEVEPIVERIAGKGYSLTLTVVPQDPILAANQRGGIRCGDNGIFKGMPVTEEQRHLSDDMRTFYSMCPSDGKAVSPGRWCTPTVCLSGEGVKEFDGYKVNPLGAWTGGPDVDTGATNRKLGSDMGDAATGGGLHGKDLSKADVSVNVFAHIVAQATGCPVEFTCSIGDDTVGGIPYSVMVETARAYIKHLGGFEKFAEWGLI